MPRPYSCFITAKLEAHGQYKSENTKNETALAGLKQTALVVQVKLAIKAVLPNTPLHIDIVETISSFAIIPTKSAQTIPVEFKPIGAKIHVILSSTKNSTLWLMLSVNCSVNVVCVSTQTIIPTQTIT